MARNGSGGVGPEARRRKGKKGKGGSATDPKSGDIYQSPPPFTFDPGLEAQRQQLERGVQDTKQDLRIRARRERQDFTTQRRDIQRGARRGRKDIQLDSRRGLRGVRFQREDLRRDASRGMQDFALRLGGLHREYAQRANSQNQEARAAGLGDSGAMAEGAQKRATNLAIERQPIDLGVQRLQQDVDTSMGRLGVAARDIRIDTRTGMQRLRQDTKQTKKLARQGFTRSRRDIGIERQRAIREGALGNVALIQQQIYAARERNPGAFSTSGKRKGKGALASAR